MTDSTQNTQTVAVITGASSGMGLATAHKVASQGCQKLYLIAKTADKLQQAANQLQQSFPKVTIETLAIDVGDVGAVKTAFATICNQEEKIDYLLLAAGISESENLAESHDTKGFEHDIQVNLTGMYACLLYAKPCLKPGSSVVTIASIRGQTPSPSGLGYAASKSGVISLTQASALQLGPVGVRVNCISPGAVYPTGMSAHWGTEKRQRIADDSPLGKLTTPEDIANAAWFFFSDESQAITGQTLSCNAGDFMS